MPSVAVMWDGAAAQALIAAVEGPDIVSSESTGYETFDIFIVDATEGIIGSGLRIRLLERSCRRPWGAQFPECIGIVYVDAPGDVALLDLCQEGSLCGFVSPPICRAEQHGGG